LATKSEYQTDTLEDSDSRLRSESIPLNVRIANIRKDVEREMQAQNLSPMRYFSQGTLPRAYIPRLPVNAIRRQPFGGVIVSGYNPVLYDATWRHKAALPQTGVSYTAAAETLRMHCCNSEVFAQNYPSDLQKNLLNDTRPRSMSLSASSSSTKSCSHFPVEDATLSLDDTANNDNPTPRETEFENPALSVTFSTLDNENDVKTIFSANLMTKKHQSLTLV